MTEAPPRSLQLPGYPFAARALPGGRWAVVSLTITAFPGNRGEVAVLAVRGGTARLVRTVRLPRAAACRSR